MCIRDRQETEAFEEYSDLDYLGRCGTAYANVGQELMPADGEKRGSIGQVKPTGWHKMCIRDSRLVAKLLEKI